MAGESNGYPRPVQNRAPQPVAPPFGAPGPDPFGNLNTLELLRQPIRPSSAFKIGGQWYKTIDNGRAEVLVPVLDPFTSPAELARQRAAVQRVALMAENPLAGAAYGIASAAGASPQTRDRAMIGGALANQTMLAGAPMGVRAKPTARPPRPLPPLPPGTPRDAIRYDLVNANGDGVGANATVSKPMLGTGARVRGGLKLAGVLDSRKQDRSHLMAQGVGGKADTAQHAIALDRGVNRGAMRIFEKAVMDRVRAGEIVEYFVKALYSPASSSPSAVVMSAHGSRGEFKPMIIRNPAPRPR